jgi:hypothetical protein
LLWTVAFVPYGWLVLGSEEFDVASTRRWVLGSVVFAGVFLVCGPALFSDDIYRYLWDAHITLAGGDPYAYAPDDPALAPLRTQYWARINNPEVPTIYPPGAQGVFLFAGLLGGEPWSMKLIALLAHIGCILVVERVSGSSRALVVYGLNPLALVESALNGHVDIFVGLFALLFGAALARGKLPKAVCWVGFVSATKLVGIVLAPLLALRSRRMLVVACVVALAPAWPLLTAGHASDRPSGLNQFARRWSGNAGLYHLLEEGAGYVVDGLATSTGSRPGQIHLPFLRDFLENAQGSSFDPRWGVRDPKKPPPDITAFSRTYVAALLARALAFAFVLATAFLCIRRRLAPLLAVRWVLLITLLLSPQVHPWYLLWLLPIEAAVGRWTGIVWSACVLAAYAPLEGWLVARVWEPHPMIVWIEYSVVLCTMGWEWRHHARAKLAGQGPMK